jgi:hypothetical protein
VIVLRKTMEAAVEAQRQIGANAVMQLARSYGDALNRVTALQKQLAAWVLNEPDNITPQQMAQMFYAQNDEWQAEFFNTMQDQVRAHHDSLPPPRHGCTNPPAGVPAGEGQWYFMAKHLDDEGFETIEAMLDHAKHHREARNEAAYERQQEALMESGGYPTIRDQQIAAMEFK